MTTQSPGPLDPLQPHTPPSLLPQQVLVQPLPERPSSSHSQFGEKPQNGPKKQENEPNLPTKGSNSSLEQHNDVVQGQEAIEMGPQLLQQSDQQVQGRDQQKEAKDCSRNTSGSMAVVQRKRTVTSRVKRSSRYWDEQRSQPDQFKFPFANRYLGQGSEEYLKMLEVSEGAREKAGKLFSDSYVNCDVRYFNWGLFVQDVGKFEVMLIDPPWRIKGAQQNDSQFMFSNCKFSLEYNTMANSQISRIPLHLISDHGFIFLWILNSQLDSSVEIMEQWGYQLVQEVIWVKLKDQKINMTHGYYFMHSYQVCLIGYKKNSQAQDKPMMLNSNVSWNTVFAEVREKSQKPEDIYAIIDLMFKGKKKIQIFARNHNLRFGFFSVGNQLGQSYDKWLLRLSCDSCGVQLSSGKQRFKSRHKPNYDLCQKCVPEQKRGEFFALSNDMDQNIRHEYVSCNICDSEPIWGIRFQCSTCPDFDVCQNCFDKNLQNGGQWHPVDHQFNFLEVPVFGNGFHIHETKCVCCYQQPIIGIYFSCGTCRNHHLCQKCYFERPKENVAGWQRRHRPQHSMEVIFESQVQRHKKYECFGCRRRIDNECWMCQNCYNFFFCGQCYADRHQFKSLYANTHKKYHVLTQIF